MENRPIVIYGCGNEGKRFYWKYRNRLNILFAIDQNSKENSHFYDLPKHKLKEVRHIEKYYIVVTVGEEYWINVKEQLEQIGLNCGSNFIWHKWFESKKRAVLYGNCHMVHLMKYLRSNIEFQREYDIFLYRINYFTDDRIETFKDDVSHCDLFITQDIREGNKFNMPSADDLISLMQEGSISLRIPNLYSVNLFYPQIDLERLGEQDFIEDIAFYIMGRGDEIIESGFKEGKTVEEMEVYIQDVDVFPYIDIRKKFDTEMKKLKKREEKCDISISDFIEENYKEIQLFYEPTHPTNIVFWEKANRILKLLGFDAISEKDAQLGFLDGCDQSEAFIYPCVREALGLQYEQRYIRKNRKGGFRNSALTLKEYIEDYYKVLGMRKRKKRYV